MTIKSILCIFDGLASEMSAVDTAFTLGKAYGSHIRFLHISPDPRCYAATYGFGDAMAFPALFDTIEQENEEQMQQAQKHIESLALRYHVTLDTGESPTHQAMAEFVHMTGYPQSILAEEGCLCDLIIAGRTKSNALYDDTLTAALFNTGRPVILVPQQPMPNGYKTVVVAWKGSQEAGRALFDAMPFLEHAEKVIVLTAQGASEDYDQQAEAALMKYLGTHGVSARSVVVPEADRSAGEALLTRARELGADVLVMGAYDHTRFYETMLGGVTNYMLETADIPLLLSH